VAGPAGIPDEFLLLVEHDQLKKNCRVIWRQPTKLGVEFLSSTRIGDDHAPPQPAAA
jgi:hypothetical protein